MRQSVRKQISFAAGGVLALIVSSILFVKFATGLAAQFTDNVLRPVFGPGLIISLEKIYFNTTDKVQQFLYNPNSAHGVAFVDTGKSQVADPAHAPFNLASIPVDAQLTPEPGEGVWHVRDLAAFPGQTVMAYTYVRSDPARPYAQVTIVQIDLHKLRLAAVAGTKEPGGAIGKFGAGRVPESLVTSGALVAAFDGGFQYRDGAYGMIVGDTTYLPLQKDLATVVGYQDGTVKLIKYEGQSLGQGVVFVRQNCPMLIENGQVTVNDPADRLLWGRTTTVGIYTWRSGMGLTSSGNLLFAVGNNLMPSTLARALQMAGATSAMQLDINPYWVRFNIFDTEGAGQYKTSTLVKDLKDGSYAYLHGYTKDFFYLYKPQ